MFRSCGMLVLLCCLLHLRSSNADSLPVPLLTWNSKSEPQDQPDFVTSGHTQHLDTIFQNKFEPTLAAGKLFLFFVQDELSMDDFVKYSSSFPHLQKVMDTRKYDFFPSVSGDKSLSELVSNAVNNVEFVDSSSLNDWKYNGKKNVVVFNLEPVVGSSSKGRGDILSRNDHVMHLITKTLRQEGKTFDVVYTAEEPSQLVSNFLLNEEIADATFDSRHLLGSSDNATTLFNNSCVLMYVGSIKFEAEGEEVEFMNSFKKEDVGGCGSKNVGCSISLNSSKGSGNFTNVTLFMDLKNDTQEWYCNSIHFTYTYNFHTGNKTVVYPEKTVQFPCGTNASAFESSVYDTIRAPIGMSFSCHDLMFQGNSSWLSLGGVQLQPFCYSNLDMSSFSGSYHCVGFFTIPILTGIFVTVVLMLGLYMGIMMMMAIQVQDRYDDPKGKTISVTAAHAD